MKTTSLATSPNPFQRCCDVNVRDSLGRTALMYACIETQREDVVRQLVKREEIDPNIRDNEGNTAVIHAVHAGGSDRDREIP